MYGTGSAHPPYEKSPPQSVPTNPQRLDSLDSTICVGVAGGWTKKEGCTKTAWPGNERTTIECTKLTPKFRLVRSLLSPIWVGWSKILYLHFFTLPTLAVGEGIHSPRTETAHSFKGLFTKSCQPRGVVWCQ